MTIGTMIFLLLGAQAPLTLAEALALPPEQAGDRALAALEHGPIVSVERAPQGIGPPGLPTVIMREKVQQAALGCFRNGWSVIFRFSYDRPEDDSPVSKVFPRDEVMLGAFEACPEVGYTRVGSDLSAAQALAALDTLNQVVQRKKKPLIICKDETSTAFCRSNKTALRELGRIKPWLVTNQSGPVEIWLGTPGQMITIVTFDKAADGALRIVRKIPAPF